MSQENVEIGMRANAAFNSRDVDAALRFFSPDAELRDLANAPDQARAVKGIEAIREAWTLGTRGCRCSSNEDDGEHDQREHNQDQRGSRNRWSLPPLAAVEVCLSIAGECAQAPGSGAGLSYVQTSPSAGASVKLPGGARAPGFPPRFRCAEKKAPRALRCESIDAVGSIVPTRAW